MRGGNLYCGLTWKDLFVLSLPVFLKERPEL